MTVTIPPTEVVIGIIAVLAIVAVAGGWIYLKFFGSR